MNLRVFKKQESDYFSWVGSHPNGLVLNTRANLSPDYMVLHRASCKLVTGYLGKAKAGGFTERAYRKVCAPTIGPILTWVADSGGKLSRCSHCDPHDDELGAYYSDLEANVQESLKDEAGRHSRLAKASKIPKKAVVTTTTYIRNPDVVAEVLIRAKGKCERCGNSAPFFRAKDGAPYLEVHHLKQLSLGGEDSVENAQAQCPNCHRESHFGMVS